ncbi:MAG: hypothetical protein ACUVQZ_06515 [Candidatus Caldatribacteriaceae bacterium]
MVPGVVVVLPVVAVVLLRTVLLVALQVGAPRMQIRKPKDMFP